MANEKKRVVAPHDLSPDDFELDAVAKLIRVKSKSGDLPKKIVTQLTVDNLGNMRWLEDGEEKFAQLADLIPLPDGVIENLTFTDWGHVAWTMNGESFTYDIYPAYSDDDWYKQLGVTPDGDLKWYPFALRTVAVGGTNAINIDPLNSHGAMVQINAVANATHFQISAGTSDGELFVLANRDPNTPFAIEVDTGLSVIANKNAVRTATGGVSIEPTGLVWVRVNKFNAVVWGDLVTDNSVPAPGDPLDRLAIDEEGNTVWMPMNLPSLVYNTDATTVIDPAVAHGRLVHIDPGPTTALQISGGSGADDWFFIVNRTAGDLTIGGAGIGINAVEDAVALTSPARYILKRFGTIAVRTSVANCKIWGDLRMKTDMPVVPAGNVGSVLTSGITGDGVPQWSSPLTKTRAVLTAAYGVDQEEGTFAWHTVAPETLLGSSAALPKLVVDPVGDSVGFAHYFSTSTEITSVEIADQPGTDRCLTFVTNTASTAVPITKQAGVPTIVSAFAETPYIKPGGTAQILFDNRDSDNRRVAIWGDLQAAP